MLLTKSGPGKAKTVAAPKKGPIVRQPILPRKLLKDEQRNQVMGEEERRLQLERNQIMPARLENDENA